MGPFVELSMRAVTFLDDPIRTDQRAAQDSVREMIAALEDDIEGKDSTLG